MIGDRWGVGDDGGTTRLLLKVVARCRRWAAPAISVGDLVMARRQLLALKDLAERRRHQATREQDCRPERPFRGRSNGT